MRWSTLSLLYIDRLRVRSNIFHLSKRFNSRRVTSQSMLPVLKFYFNVEFCFTMTSQLNVINFILFLT